MKIIEVSTADGPEYYGLKAYDPYKYLVFTPVKIYNECVIKKIPIDIADCEAFATTQDIWEGVTRSIVKRKLIEERVQICDALDLKISEVDVQDASTQIKSLVALKELLFNQGIFREKERLFTEDLAAAQVNYSFLLSIRSINGVVPEFKF